MNAPTMQGLNLNAPAYVKNPRLLAWVAFHRSNPALRRAHAGQVPQP